MERCLQVLDIPHHVTDNLVVYDQSKVSPLDEQRILDFKSLFLTIEDRERMIGETEIEYTARKYKSKL